jgi:hypothetical protein
VLGPLDAPARPTQPIDDTALRCTECKNKVDEFTAIAEGWGYYSDGCGDLMPFCPECARPSSRPTLPRAGKCLSFCVAATIRSRELPANRGAGVRQAGARS